MQNVMIVCAVTGLVLFGIVVVMVRKHGKKTEFKEGQVRIGPIFLLVAMVFLIGLMIFVAVGEYRKHQRLIDNMRER